MENWTMQWKITEAEFVNGDWEPGKQLECSEDIEGAKTDPHRDCIPAISSEAEKAFEPYCETPGHFILQYYRLYPDGHRDDGEWKMRSHTQQPHSKECAYDGFGQELYVGDKVVFAASRWTGDYILYSGEVVGWTDKMVKVRALDGATNSDKPAGMEYQPLIGKVQSRKPDKIFKIPK